jgi:hypothetical protein
LTSGDYTLALLDGNGCHLDTIITIGEPAGQLTVELGPDIEINLGELATVSADIVFSTPLESVVWNYSPGCDSLLAPGQFCTEFTYPTPPLNSYRHTITVTDINGCVTRDDVNVIVDKPRQVYVPNVFDPESSDPDNSGVRIYMGPDVLKVKKWLIFDRWGENVHEVIDVLPGDFNHAWYGKIKGEKAHQGVYVWYAIVEFIDGEVIEYKGDVTVAR